MAKTPDEVSLNGADHINQIRDILLGPQKRDYDQRFERTQADIRAAKDELRTRGEELEGALRTEISALQRALDQQVRALSASLQEQTTKLQQSIAQADEKNRADHRQELETARAKLQAELRSTKEQLSRDIESHVQALREGKVSRDAMAELLQELAIKLKGVEIVSELKKASRKSQAGE